MPDDYLYAPHSSTLTFVDGGGWAYPQIRTTTSYTLTNAELWTTWTMPAYTNTATTTGYTWNTWNNAVSGRDWCRERPTGEWNVERPINPFSAEEMAAASVRDIERREAAARQATEAQLRQAEAAGRARELLISCLNAEQREEFARSEHFYVTAPSGRVYLIRWGYAGNVESEGWIYCAHLLSSIPIPDQMLAQKLHIETDEEDFLRIANRSRAINSMAA